MSRAFCIAQLVVTWLTILIHAWTQILNADGNCRLLQIKSDNQWSRLILKKPIENFSTHVIHDVVGFTQRVNARFARDGPELWGCTGAGGGRVLGTVGGAWLHTWGTGLLPLLEKERKGEGWRERDMGREKDGGEREREIERSSERKRQCEWECQWECEGEWEKESVRCECKMSFHHSYQRH